MAEIVMPKNVLDDVLSSLGQVYHQPFIFFLNRPQRWLFWIMVAAVGGLGLLVLLFNLSPWPGPQWTWWAKLGVFFTLMVYLSAWVYVVVSMVALFRRLLPPERGLLGPVMVSFNKELELRDRLAHTYEPRDLAYALDRLTLAVTQFRSRFALLIGALDKVGVIPLAIGAYSSIRALFKEKPPSPSELSWLVGVAIGLGVIYLGALGILRWAQGLDEACLVLKHAGQAKQAPPEVDQTTSS